MLLSRVVLVALWILVAVPSPARAGLVPCLPVDPIVPSSSPGRSWNLSEFNMLDQPDCPITHAFNDYSSRCAARTISRYKDLTKSCMQEASLHKKFCGAGKGCCGNVGGEIVLNNPKCIAKVLPNTFTDNVAYSAKFLQCLLSKVKKLIIHFVYEDGNKATNKRRMRHANIVLGYRINKDEPVPTRIHLLVYDPLRLTGSNLPDDGVCVVNAFDYTTVGNCANQKDCDNIYWTVEKPFGVDAMLLCSVGALQGDFPSGASSSSPGAPNARDTVAATGPLAFVSGKRQTPAQKEAALAKLPNKSPPDGSIWKSPKPPAPGGGGDKCTISFARDKPAHCVDKSTCSNCFFQEERSPGNCAVGFCKGPKNIVCCFDDR